MKDTDFANYVDDNSPYTKSDTLNDVIETFESESIRLLQQFKDNQIKGKKDKCQLLVNVRCYKGINVCGAEIKIDDCEKLLAIEIDSMLKFKERLIDILTKVSYALYKLF